MSNSLKKQRDSNLELLRILLMLAIIAHHYFVNSGVVGIAVTQTDTRRAVFFLLVGAWGKTAINCFVLITGYFMCRSKLTLRKFLLLLGEFLFYNLTVHIIFCAAGRIDFSVAGLLKAVNPFSEVGSSFTPAFFLLYLAIPFLNLLISNMDCRRHFLLVALLVFIYTVLGTDRNINVTFNYFSWFVTIYLLAAFLRIYPDKIKFFQRWIFPKFCFFTALGLLSIYLLIKKNEGAEIGIYTVLYYYIFDSNKILALLISVFAFLFFKNLRIGNSKIINGIAQSTFGIFLIHTNSPEMRRWLWVDLLKNTKYYQAADFRITLLHYVLSVLAVFTVCLIIDRLRIELIEKPVFKLWDKYEDKLLSKLNKIPFFKQ